MIGYKIKTENKKVASEKKKDKTKIREAQKDISLLTAGQREVMEDKSWVTMKYNKMSISAALQQGWRDRPGKQKPKE